MTGRVPTAGQLTERLRVERRRVTADDDGLGNFEGSWSVIASGVPARINATRGGEQIRARRLSGISNFDVVVRYDSATSTITAADRLVDERNTATTFNVLWVGDLDGDRRWLHIAAERGGRDG